MKAKTLAYLTITAFFTEIYILIVQLSFAGNLLVLRSYTMPPVTILVVADVLGIFGTLLLAVTPALATTTLIAFLIERRKK